MRDERILPIFAAALLVECAASVLGLMPLRFVSKPSLMLILFVYFLFGSKGLPPFRKLILAALAFSWLGDVALLIEKAYGFSRPLFMAGLGSFVVVHLCYLSFFVKAGRHNSGGRRLDPFLTGGVLLYAGVFYLYLLPHLHIMRSPVLIYCLLISAMLIACLHAYDLGKQRYGIYCVAGTVLFVLSDSVLAYNRFVENLPFDGILVMVPYAVGQFLIVRGALGNLRDIPLK